MRKNYVDTSAMELEDRVVAINRVAKVVKGGRNFRFSVLVVVGDQNGHVGVGTGKAAEIPEAIRKGIQDAKKKVVKVSLLDGTVPHQVVGISGAGRVLLKPAPEGNGVIAGGAVRAVCEMAGIQNVTTKNLGSPNPRNTVMAAMDALENLKNAEEVARLRGKTVEEIFG